MKNYKKLKIWMNAMEMGRLIYKATEKFPKDELYGMTSQIRRATMSIPANIAEGCSRRSRKDFKRFLEISLGSCFEVETFLDFADRIGYFNFEDDLRDALTQQLKMTQGLITKIENELNQ